MGGGFFGFDRERFSGFCGGFGGCGGFEGCGRGDCDRDDRCGRRFRFRRGCDRDCDW